MGQRKNFAIVMAAPTKPPTEESASNMGQSAKFAAITTDAQTKPLTEESVTSMGQSANVAVVWGAPALSRKEESASGMERRSKSKNATMKIAQREQ